MSIEAPAVGVRKGAAPHTARETLGGALAASDHLPLAAGDHLVDAAHDAFTQALGVSASIGATLLLAAVAAVALLRRAGLTPPHTTEADPGCAPAAAT